MSLLKKSENPKIPNCRAMCMMVTTWIRKKPELTQNLFLYLSALLMHTLDSLALQSKALR